MQRKNWLRKRKDELRLKVYSDGACRGNPGPSAIAFMILTDSGEILKRGSAYVGFGTNNQAEYKALISALDAASKMESQEVVCYLDSQLVVKQLNGEYQVKNPNLRKLWFQVHDLKRSFQKISFMHVPRTEKHIEEVDSLANQTLRQH
jgi:ribonuclease HI